FNNRGNVLVKGLKRFDDALASYDTAIELKADYAIAFYNRGLALRELRRFDEAVASYERSLAINSDQRYVLGELAQSALKMCDWARTTELTPKVKALVAEQITIVHPFSFLAYSSDAALQLKCARQYVQDQMLMPAQPLWTGPIRRHDKLRIGYLSADFKRH